MPLAAPRSAACSSLLLLVTLAAATAACGDDEPSGAGGAGTTTAATTTTTTTTSTTTTGGGQGGSGAGGGGEGGAGGSGGAGGDGGGTTAACDGLPESSPPLTVITVDEVGTPVEVERVVWQVAPADPFWLDPEEAGCAGGDTPPCSTWEIVGELPERIAVTAERRPGEDTEECLSYASTFALVHAPDGAGTAPQLLHLTLPSDATYCIDPDTGMTVVSHDHDETIDEADCLVPPPAVEGPIVLSVVDQDGEPVPAASAVWYYPPKGPDFDGEHPLACVDQRCETWVVAETPQAGTIYVAAAYSGPLNPFFQTGWSGFDAGPFEVEVDDRGEIVPMSIQLVLDTTLEGAIGG